GRWVGQRLSSNNHHQLWIPPGFAHGFLTLSEFAEVFYKTTDFYAPSLERAICWKDATLGIDWPLTEAERQDVLVSAKDAQAVAFEDAEYF
ncbi:MAG: dTDP-4-dehydrorhamnose 3,5-epimerase, partial [Proteobacteria bacterium]|nr:dTDP-4-dehydrorhamnose 3,5-epimerase [Pseudomonadota bacterium]